MFNNFYHTTYVRRVIHSLRKWLQLSYDDFKDEDLSLKLNSFIATIQR